MAFFVYERSFDRSWQPCVYFEKPSESINKTNPERSTLHEIAPELLGEDGVSPRFAKLMELYPAPKEG